MGNQNDITADSVELNTTDGVAFIEQASPLTRLHYFDGKFLKADALAQEQAYHRTQVQLANVSGGWGLVHGLGVGLSPAGDAITVTGGLAITPAGHFVMTLGDVGAKIAELLKLAAPAPAVEGNTELANCAGKQVGSGVKETAALGLYEITVGPIEGLCGNEPVYGALCESACVSDSRRPYWREGLVLRLRPITLQLPTSAKVPLSTTHLRNRVASAYFAVEPGATGSALSASGLASGVWCNPASLYGRDEVVVGLLTRDGGVSKIDAWSGRRERIEAQAKGYWQGRMSMRPWNVYLAQILQFQCQLSGVFDDTSVVVKTPNNCDDLRSVLEQTRKEIAALHKKYSESANLIAEKLGAKPTQAEARKLADNVKGSYAELYDLSEKLSGVEIGQGALPKNRLLLNNGFVQLPPAGYLPVQPGKTALPDQLSRMFGEGVRLHYRAARADVLPHLLEEAQHMERISLTQGIDHPDALEDVEIFVPDGKIVDLASAPTGIWWDVSMSASARKLLSLLDQDSKDSTSQASLNDTLVAEQAQEDSLTGMQRLSSGMRINTNLKRFQSLATTTLNGLARTEAREDGTYGLTLAASTDPDEEISMSAATPEALYQLQDKLQDKLSYMRKEATGDQTIEVEDIPNISMAWYIGADIATDPFTLEVGDEAAIKAEVRMLNSAPMRGPLVYDQQVAPTIEIQSNAMEGSLSGSLTVLKKQAQSKGGTLLIVEIEANLSSTQRTTGEAPTTDKGRTKTRFGLVRRGDGSTGVLLLDDPAFDDTSAPIAFNWEDDPRLATVTMAQATQKQRGAVMQLMDALGNQQDSVPANQGDQADQDSTDTSTRTLATLRGLTQAPQPSSTIGAGALNTVVALSEATEDAAFLVRAQRRLFPNLEAGGQTQVQAVLDWVMFRRLRPTFCDPVCAAPVMPEVEAFQIWHVRVDSDKQVKALQTRLDQNDPLALAEFKVQAVGVLRYRDDNTQPEESHAKVLAMWQQAQPAAKVVLGRAWETTPTAGQGWQNHFRLREMLDQISTLTQPPARGGNAVATLAQAPAPLAKGALDGGFLVVTTGTSPAVQSYAHRVIMLGMPMWSEMAATFKKSTDEGWKRLAEIASSKTAPVADLSLTLVDNALAAKDAEALVEAKNKVVTQLGFQNKAMAYGARIEGPTLSEGELPAVQFEAIIKALDAGQTGQVFTTTSITDLGGGAHVLTVIALEEDQLK